MSCSYVSMFAEHIFYKKILYNEKINNEKLSGREKMIIFKV